MSVRRVIAYLGLVIGLALLIWAGFMRYPLGAEQTESVNGYGVVREAARDGLIRDDQGTLTKRGQAKPTGKDDKACPT